ncbi:hypothetical protein SLEP1_g59026 [Rubroshorea leprosula]|uniref:Cytochrome P450 n=1 Tax=Rubroshorea leprosula TaxID=152421 RepID=A0AAV5MTZ0_9ROSI|nr:hypothetical protein SLEP1_g59026 [Rubroshorea leprosula]
MADIFLYFIALVILYSFAKHFLLRIQNLPPSPFPCLPVIGHLYLLKKPLFRTLAKIADRHGSIVFLQFGCRPVVVVSSPSAAEECLSKNDIIFASRPRLMVGKHIGNNHRSLSWSPYGDHWRNLRRIASIEILSTSRLQMLSNIRVDEVRSLMRKLVDFQDKPVELWTVIFELTLNVMTRMIAGKRFYGANVADVEEARRFQASLLELQKLNAATNYGDFLPWLKSKKLEQRMIECQRTREGLFLALIEQSRRKMKSDNTTGRKNTMIEVLLSLQESEPEYYTDKMIANLVLVLLTAGTETTSNTLEWALSLLLNHPEVMEKARKEIENVVGLERLIEESDLPKLSYLRGIISETMRMYPPVPLLLPHESTEDCTVGGYRIPAETLLFINVWAIQNDPKVWEDPRKFKPERFEGVEGTGRDGFKLMPFGSGRRACPGDGLALRMVGFTLGSLIQCFEWEKIEEETVDITEGIGLTMPKAVPLQAKCRPWPAMIKLLSQL